MRKVLALLTAIAACVAVGGTLSAPVDAGTLSTEYTCTPGTKDTGYSKSSPSNSNWSGSVSANWVGHMGANQANAWAWFRIERGSSFVEIGVNKQDGGASQYYYVYQTAGDNGGSSGTGTSVSFGLTYNSSTLKYTLTIGGVTKSSNLQLGGPATYAESWLSVFNYTTQLCANLDASVAPGVSMSGWTKLSGEPYYVAELLSSSTVAHFYTGSQV